MYRLENGKLKGIRVKNDFGMEEWRIYPTKEIVEGLQRALAINPTAEPAQPAEAIYDAEEVGYEEDFPTYEEETSWGEKEREKIKQIAEEFMRPLLEKIDSQTKELAYREIELNDLKVKLLPDLEKQAEAERKVAELKELEAEALRKQIAALQAEQKNAEEDRLRAKALEQTISELQTQKDSEILEMQKRMDEMAQQLSKNSESWWKKWFSPSV
jgi:hypothetical protein